MGNFLAYEYMVYLRHYGFPSPLLDWSMSPYVAAYFSFRELNKAENVSIFAFIEDYGFDVSHPANSNVIRLGPYIRSPKRHFLQQSDYTICTKRENGTTFMSVMKKHSLEKVLGDKFCGNLYCLQAKERRR